MNTIVKLSVGGALALGAVSANASIGAPSSGTSDAILFAEVVNGSGTVLASYAGDTGVSLANLATGTNTTGTVLTNDSNLTALFNADAAGDTLYWAVEAGQWTGGGGTVNNNTCKTAGDCQTLTTITGNSTTQLAGRGTGNLSAMLNSLNTDVGTIQTNINTPPGNGTSVEGSSAATAGVWDINSASGIAYWYGQGTGAGNTALSATLYAVTGGGSLTSKVVVTALGTASLTAAGLTLPTAVPLPAAVWLLGSGLVGLAGVARRKLKA